MRWLLLFLLMLFTVLGDILQSREMKLVRPRAELPGAFQVLKLIVVRNYLLLSILCMAMSFFAFLALVQTEPISFAVPASAGSFVVDTVFARFLLKERLSRARTLGALCVLAGILLVAR